MMVLYYSYNYNPNMLLSYRNVYYPPLPPGQSKPTHAGSAYFSVDNLVSTNVKRKTVPNKTKVAGGGLSPPQFVFGSHVRGPSVFPVVPNNTPVFTPATPQQTSQATVGTVVQPLPTQTIAKNSGPSPSPSPPPLPSKSAAQQYRSKVHVASRKKPMAQRFRHPGIGTGLTTPSPVFSNNRGPTVSFTPVGASNMSAGLYGSLLPPAPVSGNVNSPHRAFATFSVQGYCLPRHYTPEQMSWATNAIPHDVIARNGSQGPKDYHVIKSSFSIINLNVQPSLRYILDGLVYKVAFRHPIIPVDRAVYDKIFKFAEDNLHSGHYSDFT